MSGPWDDYRAKPAATEAAPWDEYAGGPPAQEAPSPPASSAPLAATGQLHDGDTFRLTDGRNARLYGADAFELAQTGRDALGHSVPLGAWAKARAAAFAVPGSVVTPTGAMTYGRPVVSLSKDGEDAGAALLHDGLALATPKYLQGDLSLLTRYMQEERLARLNRRGAHAGTFQTPEEYRRNPAVPAPGEYGNAQALFFDDPTPYQGLPPEQEKGLMSIWQDFKKGPADYVAYAKANGIEVDPAIAAEQFRKRDRDKKAGGNGISAIARPRVLTDPGDGAFGATLRGLADPLNMLDEAGAVVDTLLPGSERENVWGSDRRFGDVYANNLEQNRAILDHDDRDYRWYRFGGQLASGVAMPGASVEGVGLAATRSALRGGASRYAAEQAARRAFVGRLGAAGAVEGGLAGIGQGETAGERVAGGLIGAPAGGALAVGAGVAAPRLAQLVGRPFSRARGRAGEQAAEGFADGALDTGKAIGNNDALEMHVPDPMDMSGYTPRVRDRLEVPMASEVDQPALYGPAFSDDAAPASTPRDLMASAPDAERRAAAERLTPPDVMPLPSNAVDGIDEAARIDRGRYEPVRGGDEAQQLASRSIPHARTGTPINVRGPLDLASWLRMEGGLRPVGGELQHLGITNAPRKGMEMTGGDRLGPLIADDGMSYDDAVYRAWEAGFFPDRAEPPSINELLDAVEATHTGRDRLFRPDDLPEVEAFHGARQQRWDVERAANDGAPLTNDRSQPVGVDDLDANAPPVRAYEEWGENAPNLAGNIRLEKLDSPQAIKRALVQTERVTGGFDAARRGRITQAETASLAADLGMTADDLLKRRAGQALNAEEALAARQILARSATDLVNMAKRISRTQNPGDEMEGAFREAWLRHAAIQEQVAGMTAEAGRALQQFRQVADARAVGRVLPDLGTFSGGTARLKEVADRIVDLEATGQTGKVTRYALTTARNPTAGDMATEYYINALLSGPQTHATNILSNTLTSLLQIPEHAAAAMVGAVRRRIEQAGTRLTGREMGNADRVLFSEVGGRTVGLLQGTKEGLSEAWRSFRTGESSDAMTKLETQQMKAIPGRAGEIIRLPTRLLSAEDELFKGMARRMELTGLAMRIADREGLRGAGARRRVADLIENPSDDMIEKARDYARYLTFQSPLGETARHISAFANSTPGLRLLLPFVRTPTNLLKFALERSPAAPLLKEWRREVMAGGARRDTAVARALVGTGIAAMFYEAALDGRITGGGPADDNAKRLMLANGWQPYSIRVGDRYYSYRRLDPLATTIGTVADMVDLGSHMTEKQRERSGTLITAAILNNLASKTWLTGISGAAEALADPERNWDSFIAQTAAGIATPAIMAQITRTSDPILREARTPLDRIRSRIPGVSDTLFPRRDVLGRPIMSEGGVGPDMVSPIWTGTARNDPTLNALLAADATISPPQRSYKEGGKRLEWTPAEYDRLQEATGRLAQPRLAALVQAAQWARTPQDDQQKAVAKVMEQVRAEAKAQVKRGLFGAPMRDDAGPWQEWAH